MILALPDYPALPLGVPTGTSAGLPSSSLDIFTPCLYLESSLWIESCWPDSDDSTDAQFTQTLLWAVLSVLSKRESPLPYVKMLPLPPFIAHTLELLSLMLSCLYVFFIKFICVYLHILLLWRDTMTKELLQWKAFSWELGCSVRQRLSP